MTTLSDRLSVVRPQWEAQLDTLRTLTTRAIDSAEQLLVLNLKTSRASMEQVNGTFQQMLKATAPQDLLAIGSQAQGQWQQMFSYSRELMGIALGTHERSWSAMRLPAFAAPLQLTGSQAPAALVIEQAGIAIAEATTVHSEIATAAADSTAALAEDTLGVGDQSGAGDGAALQPAGEIEPSAVASDAPADAPTELDAEKTGETPSEAPAAEPEAAPDAKSDVQAGPTVDDETSANLEALVDIVIADEVPPVKAKPLVEALNEIAPKPVSVEHPIISTVPLEAGSHVELPLVTPADATPPVQLSSGPAPAERRRPSRKKQ